MGTARLSCHAWFGYGMAMIAPARPAALAATLLALAALIVLGWWWPNRPVDVGPDTDPRYASLSFAPYRTGQSPLTGVFPTAAQVDADLALLAPHTRTVRTYAAIEGDYDTVALAQKHGLKVWQGIWLGSDPVGNAKEMARAIALAHQFPDTITRVVVGNEVLLRRDLPVDALIADIDQVRAAVRQPVTYADVQEFWQRFPQVAAHVDIVTVHLLPYWEDEPSNIGRAVDHVDQVWQQMVTLFPGKNVTIGETGWPSNGRERQDALPSVVNQARFLRAFIALAHRRGFDYNLIEAFDQDWKYQSEGVVGANWGLWTAGRQMKFPSDGPVAEDPRWPIHAAIGIACMALLAGLALACGGARLEPRRQVQVGLLAGALGAALSYAQAVTAPVLYDSYVTLAAVVNLGGQVLMAGLLVARLARGGAPTGRTGVQATAALRGALLLKFGGLPRDADGWLDELGFLFLWTAAVLQLLLLCDPRYRDFPLNCFAVPLVGTLAARLAGQWRRGGGSWAEAWAGGTLAVAAIASAVQEGPLNHQSLTWNACALVLAAPPLLRCLPARLQTARA